MSKPTEGPWESTGTVIWSPSAKAVVACVSKLRPASGMAEFEKPDVFDADLDEIVANRDLITAAPSLLAACEQLLPYARDFIGRSAQPYILVRQIENAERAITKARGETS